MDETVKTRIEKRNEKAIDEHVKKLMGYNKKDLAIMYADLNWCYQQVTKSVKRSKSLTSK